MTMCHALTAMAGALAFVAFTSAALAQSAPPMAKAPFDFYVMTGQGYSDGIYWASNN
jgi:hypothetical protein